MGSNRAEKALYNLLEFSTAYLVTEIEGRLRSQHKLLGKIVGVMCQGDRILIPSIDVDSRLEDDRIIGPWVVDQGNTLLLLLEF